MEKESKTDTQTMTDTEEHPTVDLWTVAQEFLYNLGEDIKLPTTSMQDKVVSLEQDITDFNAKTTLHNGLDRESVAVGIMVFIRRLFDVAGLTDNGMGWVNYPSGMDEPPADPDELSMGSVYSDARAMVSLLGVDAELATISIQDKVVSLEQDIANFNAKTTLHNGLDCESVVVGVMVFIRLLYDVVAAQKRMLSGNT